MFALPLSLFTSRISDPESQCRRFPLLPSAVRALNYFIESMTRMLGVPPSPYLIACGGHAYTWGTRGAMGFPAKDRRPFALLCCRDAPLCT